eukprot:CAMPEP_0195656226 /NCGR_PEP_ID=MMETSP0815-20121206/34886_1 /TAXON_ID=97485 /ORGANISM="Prymnesium parvum, Strain Texoma1" /LENGTH=148 /DNA_ID=CAMNT_0040800581 /DNA_START=220 /DNA_END=663 /DNA_ORIENTATION=-
MAALEHAVSHKKEAAAIKSEVKYAPRIGAFEFILALSMQNLGKKAHARCIDSFPRLQQSPCWRVGFLLNGSGSAALGTTLAPPLQRVQRGAASVIPLCGDSSNKSSLSEDPLQRTIPEEAESLLLVSPKVWQDAFLWPGRPLRLEAGA